MNILLLKKIAVTSASTILLAGGAVAASSEFQSELLALQHEWAHANYEAEGKRERRSAFEALVEHAETLSARYPSEVDAIAWEGIVLSTYSGEVSALSAMKFAKAARDTLLSAEAMNGEALHGGIYASLGALYSKVPGGFVGFGDDELAREYFLKALAVDQGNIDNNYFYGEFLVEQGNYAEALEVLNHALDAPNTSDRPVFNRGRRAEIQELIRTATDQ